MANSNDNMGISLSSSSNNTLTNNTANMANSNGYGFYLDSSSNNNITGGSISGLTNYDYYLSSAGTTNNFTNTNFTSQRKIRFYDTTSWFNYQNSSNVWLKTNVSATATINRLLNNWSQTNMS
jgi:parallel beta-helix repeat protein